MEYGALVKLEEWKNTLVAIMEHGVIVIPVKERALMNNAKGDNVYINTDNVLPENPNVASQTYGSIFADSIVKTPNYIYGVDTIAKKIWRLTYNSEGLGFEIISDMKIQKFLNDNLDRVESDKVAGVNDLFVRSHYNAFKQDVIFTYKNGSKEWSICWNELLNKWITRYTWLPSFSENINNIFYTFANNVSGNNKLWKHGFSGTETLISGISPTKWYGEAVQPFEFEFVVVGVQGVQKIFNNLKIISNKATPDSFTYEIVGEGYDWHDKKQDIVNINTSSPNSIIGLTDPNQILDAKYKYYFDNLPFDSTIKKIPWTDSIKKVDRLNLVYDKKLAEYRMQIYQQGKDIKKLGRIKGNMQYVEDSWDIQIQPAYFKYAYIKNNTLLKSNTTEMKIRDKYIKIRVRYSGNEMAVIQAIRTLYTISYA